MVTIMYTVDVSSQELKRKNRQLHSAGNHRPIRLQNGVRMCQAHSVFLHVANHRDRLSVCLEDQVRDVERELVNSASVSS